MDLLEEGANIYKLISSILVKQTLSESQMTIEKRIEFISKENKRVENLIKENENKQIAKRNKIAKLQETYQKIIMANY